MPRGLALFLARLASNTNKDLFIVRLGVTLLLGRFGIVGPLANLLGSVLRMAIGLLMEDGIFLIEISVDAYKEGRKLKEFEKAATEAYQKATAKVYDEKEKDEIRKQYLEIIARIGAVGNPSGV
jgi:hypothetical protein